MKQCIIFCLVLLSSLLFGNNNLSQDMNKFIECKDYYNKNAQKIVKHSGIRKNKYFFYKTLLIPTFKSDNPKTQSEFLQTLCMDKYFLYDEILFSESTTSSFFIVSYMVYKNILLCNCDSVPNKSSTNNLNVLLNNIDKAFEYLTYGSHLVDKSGVLSESDILFRVIGYEDYWFLLKEDKLWAYSLSKQILYTTEEQVTRIIQHKEVE